MSADVYPPVMNTDVRTLLKVVIAYVIAQLGFFVCLVVFGAIIVYGMGIGDELVKSTSSVVIALGVLSVLFLVPVILAVSQYHRFSNVLPNSETRLTLAMLIALVGCCFLLVPAAPEAGALTSRLASGNLRAYELLFALTSVAAAYVIIFIIAVLGIRIGLWLTKNRFVETAG